MKTRQHSTFQLGHGFFTRVLAALLLSFMLYATTVEAAHRHGRFLNVEQTSASISEGSGPTNLQNGLLDCSDCLICQLHQNFSASLVSLGFVEQPTLISVRLSASTFASFQRPSTTPTSGRAPPSNN